MSIEIDEYPKDEHGNPLTVFYQEDGSKLVKFSSIMGPPVFSGCIHLEHTLGCGSYTRYSVRENKWYRYTGNEDYSCPNVEEIERSEVPYIE